MPTPDVMCGLKVESCSRCDHTSLVHQPYSGQRLCGRHLHESIRRRVSRDLRVQLPLPKDARKEDGSPLRILAAVSGGKDSAIMLKLIVDILGRRRDLEIIAGVIDEGIDGYRSPSISCIEELCESLGIELLQLGYEEMGYSRMDEVVRMMPDIAMKNPQADGMMPCSFCGVFRRQSLNTLAERSGADVMALGHNLDDMAQSILMNLQKGEVDRSVRLAPHTSTPIDGLPPRIVPLRWIPEQEVHALAMVLNVPFYHGDCPHAAGAQRQRSREIIAALETETPGARHGLLHSLEQIRQMHASSGNTSSEIRSCSLCGGVTSREICQSCVMRAWLDEQK